MIHEFALEPELVATWGTLSEYRYFYDKFGLGQPRLMSEFPKLKTWKQIVLMAALDASDMELQRITALLSILSERVVSRSGWTYADSMPWLDNAEKEHQRRPFHSILARNNPHDNENVLCGPVLGGLEEPKWNLKKQIPVSRNPRDMARTLRGMLANCSEIIFVDPHFGPENKRHTRPLKAFLATLARNRTGSMPRRIEIHTKAKSSYDFFKEECVNRLPRIIPQGLSVLLKRWRQNQIGETLHNRYVLTDLGGVSFGEGLDDQGNNSGDDIDEVTLMEREVYELRWKQYVSSEPAFRLADSPILLEGTCRI